jgi:hypothetical protein
LCSGIPRNAAKTKDLSARPGPIQFAQLCEILADSIETRDGGDARSIQTEALRFPDGADFIPDIERSSSIALEGRNAASQASPDQLDAIAAWTADLASRGPSSCSWALGAAGRYYFYEWSRSLFDFIRASWSFLRNLCVQKASERQQHRCQPNADRCRAAFVTSLSSLTRSCFRARS